MEAIPRISRAQSMDALSSQSNVAGYRAALIGAEHARPLLPDADDRRGHDPAGQGARARRRRRRACRRSPPRAAWARSRRATTCAPRSPSRSSRSARSSSSSGVEARRGEGGYARELTDEEQRAAAAGADRRDHGLRRGHHDRARARPPGAAAGHRRGGRGDEAGQRDRRPGRRGGRQLRADRAGRDRGQARRDDRLAAEPAGDDARARLPALRAQRPGAARADDSTTTASSRWTSTTRSSPAPASSRETDEAVHAAWMLLDQPRDPRARRLRRLRGHLQGPQHAAHAADVGHQRDPRDRRARRPPGARPAASTASLNKFLLVIAIAFGTINVVGGFLVTDRMLEMFKSKPTPREQRGGRGVSRRPTSSRRPLHRRVLAVHLRPDGPDRPADRGARQPHRRRRHGASRWSRRC